MQQGETPATDAKEAAAAGDLGWEEGGKGAVMDRVPPPSSKRHLRGRGDAAATLGIAAEA